MIHLRPAMTLQTRAVALPRRLTQRSGVLWAGPLRNSHQFNDLLLVLDGGGKCAKRAARRPFPSGLCSTRGVSMAHMSGVIQQLKKERERAQKEVQHIDAALAALNGISSNGSSRHTMSAAARRRISPSQKARWAKQKAIEMGVIPCMI